MPGSNPLDAGDVATLKSYVAISTETQNPVIFTQRYASDGTAIGDPIQVTSDAVSANLVSTLLLSNGQFVVAYNDLDPADTSPPFPFNTHLATREFSADGTAIATNDLGLNDFNTSQTYQSTALSNGSYGYLQETTENFPFGGYQETKTFGFVDASGHVTQTVLAQTSGGDGPFPVLLQSAGSIHHFVDGRFSVSFTEFYSDGNPDFPPPEPVPTGQQQFNRVYDSDGDLTTSIFIDFDGTKTVERYDPASGDQTGSVVFHTDGSRLSTQFGITGRSYVEQSVATDTAGAIIEQKRYYGDSRHTLAFDLQNNPDGTSEVHNYDTSGREIVRQVGFLGGEHDVYQFAYAGAASTVPSVTTLTHYGPANTKAFVDVTQPGGDHRQTSYADGVTLVSHEAVADTFFGFAKGSDTFAFHQNFGHDVISGFASGASPNHDILQFDDSVAVDFATLSSHFQQVGADTLIALDGPNSVLLKNVTADSLTAENIQIIHDAGLLI